MKATFKLLLTAILSIFFLSAVTIQGESYIDSKDLYKELIGKNSNVPDYDLFNKGVRGFSHLKKNGRVKKDILTIIDLRLSSNKKRMWVIDLESREVIYHNLVAHGKKSGEEFAKYFSNKPESHKSSLGFYTTGKTYTGKHGLSLYLDGVEEGINDMARKRAIVIHGASYVSKTFIRQFGRLGRSFGCPALPVEIHEEVIDAIKEKSCLFIYFPDKNYIGNSKILNPV